MPDPGVLPLLTRNPAGQGFRCTPWPATASRQRHGLPGSRRADVLQSLNDVLLNSACFVHKVTPFVAVVDTNTE